MTMIALGGLLGGIGGYVLTAWALYTLFSKARYRHRFFAIFPIFNTIGVLHIIGRSGWNVLWTFVPIANLVFGILWGIDFLKSFGMNPWWLAVLVLPYLGTLAFLALTVYMAASKEVTYDIGRIGRIQA